MNFFSSFVILMFIFIFQTIWLFIDDLAGKGLDLIIIGKFLFYLLPNLSEKVLPLTVLLSSILTFGAFAENYEFAAMKASGISLQRSMRYLIIFVVFLGGVTFYFANTVIPLSEQKIYNLRRNIATLKPAAVIVEGVFSDFEGRNIKVERKYGENDRFLENVIIHMKSNLQRNTTVIRAARGELISGEGSDIIQLVLKDGHYYEDIVQKSGNAGKTHPFTRADFDTYIMNIEIPDNMEDLEADRNVETDKMKNVSRLLTDIDSIENHNRNLVEVFSKNITSRMGAFPIDETDTKKVSSTLDSLLNAKDTLLNRSDLLVSTTDTLATNKDTVAISTESLLSDQDTLAPDEAIQPPEVLADTSPVIRKDSLGIPKKVKRSIQGKDPLEPFQPWEQGQILDASRNSVKNILNSVRGKGEELELSYKRHNLHILSFHRKFALAFSCIILFFVGAPLGAIIRKGGLGLPMVIAIVLFLAYYFFGVFSGNYAKEGNIHPILGAWLPTMIMLPLGIWLTKRATSDKGLMSFGHFIDIWKEKLSRFKKKKKPQTT
jgi:lipopolysaccharide export system permease protein